MAGKSQVGAERIEHPFDPLFNEDSRVLILGSFPSVRSREQNFYYGHPRNRFWKVMATVLNCPQPQTIEAKRSLILEHHLALWDSVAVCEISGSSDSSIRSVRPNDLSVILNRCDIRRIYCNGRKSYEIYRRYIEERAGREAVLLPSTSPANARCGTEELIDRWSVITKDLQPQK